MSRKYLSELTDTTLICMTGGDAVDFAHSQFTQDIKGMPEGVVKPAAWCNPKGRIIATFYAWHKGEQVYLAIDNSLAELIVKRLSAYILRRACKIEIQTQTALAVIAPNNVEDFVSIENHLQKVRNTLQIPMELMRWVEPFALLALENTQKADGFKHVSVACGFELLPCAVWRQEEINLGLARITLANSEKFIVQMVNFELAGGVDFKKGCYPGQEVVARLQYRGETKRRAYIATSTQAFTDNQILFNAEGGESGEVIQCVANHALVCLEIANFHQALFADKELLHPIELREPKGFCSQS